MTKLTEDYIIEKKLLPEAIYMFMIIIFRIQNQKSYVLETWYAAQETQALQSLTLIYLQVRSDLVANTLEWENW